MARQPSRRQGRGSRQSSSVSALIEKARKEHASELNLSGKRLTELPEAIGQLTQLQSLNLAVNRLTALPDFLQDLTSLRELYLHGNPGLGLPEELLGPRWTNVTNKQAQPVR
jgi:Leucine-rich repeat (LRR) protein